MADGFWRYARFKNMPFCLGSHVRGGGGGGGRILRYHNQTYIIELVKIQIELKRQDDRLCMGHFWICMHMHTTVMNST